MIKLLSDTWFWVMAISINVVFSVIGKKLVDDFIVFLNKILPRKMKIDTENEKRTFYYIALMLMSLGTFYLMNKYDTVKIIENSLVVSALWLTMFSIFIYDIGINLVLSMIKKLITTKIDD